MIMRQALGQARPQQFQRMGAQAETQRRFTIRARLQRAILLRVIN